MEELLHSRSMFQSPHGDLQDKLGEIDKRLGTLIQRLEASRKKWFSHHDTRDTIISNMQARFLISALVFHRSLISEYEKVSSFTTEPVSLAPISRAVFELHLCVIDALSSESALFETMARMISKHQIVIQHVRDFLASKVTDAQIAGCFGCINVRRSKAKH